MTNPICYLHIGMAKTGSSAIQYALTKGHDHLLKCGFHYPDISNNFRRILNDKVTAGNAKKIKANLQKNDSENVMRMLRPFSEQPNNLILSCEGLSRLPIPRLRILKHGLDHLGFDTRCLVYFRPQEDLLVSRYLQEVKANKTNNRTLDEYFNQMFSSKKLNSKWNWYDLTIKLNKVFGDDKVTVKWYPSVIRSESPGVINATLDWMGITLPEELLSNHKQIVNPTPGREALVILERLNYLGWGNGDFSGAFLIEAQRQGLLGSKIRLVPSLMEKVRSATHKGNVKLLEHYCPELSAKNELAPLEHYPQPDEIDNNKVDRLKEIASDIFCKNLSDI